MVFEHDDRKPYEFLRFLSRPQPFTNRFETVSSCQPTIRRASIPPLNSGLRTSIGLGGRFWADEQVETARRFSRCLLVIFQYDLVL